MQFSAPKEFSMPQGGQSVALPVEGQSFGEWRSWVRGPSDLEDARRRKADQVIKKLASIMDHCGRPFGHRLYEAMIAFATNYPATHLPGYDISVPLADQIELRILPKLRGVELEGHEESLSDLAELVRRDLGDARFAQQIEDAIEQSASTGLFLWRGRLRVEI
jgi:hypothetical protein